MFEVFESRIPQRLPSSQTQVTSAKLTEQLTFKFMRNENEGTGEK